MKNLIKTYIKLPYDKKLVLNTKITSFITLIMVIYKFILGVISNTMILTTSIFSLLLLISKWFCIKGIKYNKINYLKWNSISAYLLITSGLIYIIYMSITMFIGFRYINYSHFVSVSITLIAFVEIGISIYGLVATKRRTSFFRSIKVINFIAALASLMVAQIALFSLSNTNGDLYNQATGLVIGIITFLFGIYVLFLPKFSVNDNAHNAYILINQNKNKLIDFTQQNFEIIIVKSFIYGSYCYIGTIHHKKVVGKIIKNKSLFQRINIWFKLLWCLFSIIIISLWILGYIGYFFRSLLTYHKLNKKMINNGFFKIHCVIKNVN